MGEVKTPGLYSLASDKNNNSTLKTRSIGLPTVIDAIQEGGGITENSDLSEVILERRLPGKDNKYKTTSLNLIHYYLRESKKITLFI